MNPSVSLLLLLLGLSQAHPLLEEGSGVVVQMDPHMANNVDISTMILTTNKNSSQFLLEGDLVAPKTRDAQFCSTNNCLWRKGSDGLVTVPYTLDSFFSSQARQLIEEAMRGFKQSTCIRFAPLTNQNNYISIQNGNGCFSSVGRQGGAQAVSINIAGCLSLGIIQHELNHALGFLHEHNRSDRDQYVSINWANISPSMIYNFNLEIGNSLNTNYDYSSIMHYGRTAFSINGQDTMVPIPNPNVAIGQTQGLSTTDILRINRLYNC